MTQEDAVVVQRLDLLVSNENDALDCCAVEGRSYAPRSLVKQNRTVRGGCTWNYTGCGQESLPHW